MALVIGYRRVSTDAQTESGAGLDAQLTTIEGIAVRLNLPLVAVHDDAGLSGALPLEQRPGLLAAIQMLGRGDVLAIARRDRLGRDLVNVAMIERLVERRGARIVSPDAPDAKDPAAQLLRSIIDCFSAYERLVIKARTKNAMAAARAKGRRTGHVPWGSRVSSDGRHLEPNPGELAILEEIRRLRHRGLTLVDICAALTEKGMFNRAGQPFKPSHVAQLLERHGDGITLRSA